MRSSASGRNAGNIAANAASHRECLERFLRIFADEYAHRFEYLGGSVSSKGKARIRCKTCGHVFETCGNFAVEHSNLKCPRCRIRRDSESDLPADGRLDERLLEMHGDGLNVEEMSARTGISIRYIPQILEEHGIGKAERESRAAARRAASLDRRSAETAERKKREAALLGQMREVMEDARSGKAARLLAKSIEEFGDRLGGFERTAEYIERFAPSWAECSHCGQRYLFFPSSKKYGRKKAGPYCSKRCCRKANNRSSNIGHRLRLHGSGDKPRDSITLDKLLERDGAICYLCGCETTKSDSYRVRGWFTAGDRYPTIDHVIPIAKGGTHTWANVRIACNACNRAKRDRLLEDAS